MHDLRGWAFLHAIIIPSAQPLTGVATVLRVAG
jgi:hypothetical protein